MLKSKSVGREDRSKALGTVREELETFRGKRAFFCNYRGNNGDALIALGAKRLLAENDIELVSSPKRADLVVVTGGFGISDVWKSGYEVLQKYCIGLPDTPVFIMPSSFFFDETDFASFFQGRRAPAFVYAREGYSLKLVDEIRFPGDVRIGLDHDTAFFLKDSSFHERLKAREAKKYILVVERMDAESVTVELQPSNQRSSIILPLLKRVVPTNTKDLLNHWVRWPLSRMRLKSRLATLGRDSDFVRSSVARVIPDFPEYSDQEVFSADISLPDLICFDSFCGLIAESAVVVTTRLHVGILAAILGKPTYLRFGGGRYQKIQGIFEHSMVDYSNVRRI